MSYVLNTEKIEYNTTPPLVIRNPNSIDLPWENSPAQFLSILRDHTEEEYQLVYKYYIYLEGHTPEVSGLNTWPELNTARKAYISIMGALYGIFDYFTAHYNEKSFKRFSWHKWSNCCFTAQFEYTYTVDNYTAECCKKVIMEKFDKDNIVKFLDKLWDLSFPF